ncbi:MAG: hypothetical protein IT195_05335 [Microthrixaceae bacterium]|nr:hypothetical protein [Microthrixaceae bacterium]
MTALVFLGIAVGIAVIGSVVVALRNRSAASTNEVEQFASLMDALKPPLKRVGEDEDQP